MARRIITYSTLGDNMKEVISSATTWGELQPDLAAAGVRFEGLKAMTNPGQVTLESLQAELPNDDFQLFLMPQKVKSGYDIEEDSDLVDEEDGESWEDTDWTLDWENPEDHVFKSYKDLAIARAKKAFALLTKAIDCLSGMTKRSSGRATPPIPLDPVLASLRAEAAKLQRNMEIFG